MTQDRAVGPTADCNAGTRFPDKKQELLVHDTGRSVMNILRDLAKSPDRALIVVTHDPRIFEFADRIAHMDDGKITEITDQRDQVRLQ